MSATLRGEASYPGGVMGTMSWLLTGLSERTRDPERERVRLLNLAYTRWYKKYRARKRRQGECAELPKERR